ncbi:MAG: helix-turn-helix domain-containing protein [Lachnospiraceae bacterium]|nr:helix-turn-helix domain-containing protein [Lachnospiraceae bacterium]
MEKENRFGEYIAKLRMEKNVSQVQLCEGLCERSMLGKFERGEREPDKLLQNRFLTRLGAVPENYENFLFHEDYVQWERRQGILHHILEENMGKARELLEEYYRNYNMENPLEKQFYLAMLAQIKRYQGADNSELVVLFEAALELTVPNLDERGFRNRILSLEEINLLLEYIHCGSMGEELFWYEEILKYIELMKCTQLAKAKIYPKTVYYYSIMWNKLGEKQEKDVVHMLELCENAIELLRNTNRLFYLWELFCMKEHLAELLFQYPAVKYHFIQSVEECREWRKTLEELYEEYHVSIGMYEFCYLYVESENYCIEDVIKIRRKMLKMSMKKLSAGICSEITVSRLEHHKTKAQRAVVRKLFDRLNLSTELCRTELVTESQEAIEKYEELKLQNNNQNSEEARAYMKQLREELRGMISMDIPSNAQILLRNEIINLFSNGEITREEYIKYMKQALEYTVPYKAVTASGKKYLTNEEIRCIHNLTLEIDWSFAEMQECITTLLEVCETPKYAANYLKMYQFCMSVVSSCIGNKGEYIQSNEIKSRVLKLLLRNRRCGGIHEVLYGMIWNNEQCEKEQTIKERVDHKRELQRCISLSALCKNTQRQQAYIDKMHVQHK